ncbi:uncharacterized protein LOC109841167 isoform X2 [Asparagus officinalis]|uniref:uncharacterized protein LOC109841167 isoform X2 n=1 Tax=Asparagus officinalis TaxID=4686 RepID=UPI00098E40E5|nr:uncharacterized protein LOC109841167 isoform X2 [Asparagus officinalis]
MATRKSRTARGRSATQSPEPEPFSCTGPKIFWSGSSLRTEATGYGLVFFARLAEMNKELKGLRMKSTTLMPLLW